MTTTAVAVTNRRRLAGEVSDDLLPTCHWLSVQRAFIGQTGMRSSWGVDPQRSRLARLRRLRQFGQTAGVDPLVVVAVVAIWLLVWIFAARRVAVDPENRPKH